MYPAAMLWGERGNSHTCLTGTSPWTKDSVTENPATALVFPVSIRMSQLSHYPGHHSLLDVQIGYTSASLEKLQTTNSLSVCGKLPPGVEPDPHTNSEHHPQLFYCWHNLFNTFHLCQEHKRWLPTQCKVQKENSNLSET